jgi:hypothetical protein
VVAPCAPEAHHAIWRRWRTASVSLDGVEHTPLWDLPASAVLQYHEHTSVEALASRYLLDAGPWRTLQQRTAAQAALDALFPNGAFYEQHQAADGTIEGFMLSRPVVTNVGDDWIEISAPPHAYPLPLSWQVPATVLETEKQPGTELRIQLAPADDEGTIRRISDRIDRPGVNLVDVARDRATINADHFDFDYSTQLDG